MASSSHLADTMNPEQAEVIAHVLGPLCVAAVAGCGKTRVLVHRIAALIESGVDPARVLAVTFSKKAAMEMNARLVALGCSDLRVGTFHSLALQICREERPEFKSWDIDDKDRYRFCVKDAVGYKAMDWKSADITHLLSYITRCKAAGAMPDSAQALEIATLEYKRKGGAIRDPRLCADAYIAAEIIRRERQLLTFDDMLIEAWLLLKREESIRVRWACRWDHVLQDESQDENFVQHELASLLARDHRNYMIVGDTAQSIYAFRGADPTAMLKFEGEWNARVVSMARNYRSADSIVAVANKSLAAMPADTHLGVSMIASRGVEGRVSATEYSDFDAEGDGVTEKILESHEDGRAWRDHVVLFRTNAQSRGVEECLLSARVPYVVIGGTNFYDRREVKDLLSYLRIAAGRGSFDDVRRSINTPFRFLGKVFVDALEAQVGCAGPGVADAVRAFICGPARLQQRQKTSALEYCEIITRLGRAITLGLEAGVTNPGLYGSPLEVDAKPAVLLEGLSMDLRYAEWLTRSEGTESPENNRVSNVRELIRAAGRFQTVGQLLDYIDDVLRRAAVAKREAVASDVVTLCSIHRSKGLEWPVVFVIGCNEKILPHALADDDAEERRLFYVSCTRARDVLELSCVAEAAVGRRVLGLEPSRFLGEVGIVPTMAGVLTVDAAVLSKAGVLNDGVMNDNDGDAVAIRQDVRG